MAEDEGHDEGHSGIGARLGGGGHHEVRVDGLACGVGGFAGHDGLDAALGDPDRQVAAGGAVGEALVGAEGDGEVAGVAVEVEV